MEAALLTLEEAWERSDNVVSMIFVGPCPNFQAA